MKPSRKNATRSVLRVILFALVCFPAGLHVCCAGKVSPALADAEGKPTPNREDRRVPFSNVECAKNEQCVPSTRCSSRVVGRANMRFCTTNYKTDGICCPAKDIFAKRFFKRSAKYDYEHVASNAVLEGRRMYADRARDVNLHRKVMTSEGGAPLPFHQLLQSPSLERDQQQHEVYENVFASKVYADSTNMTLEQRQSGRFGELPKKLRKRCASQASCDPHARYRSFDGTCNNPHPERSHWGAAGQPFKKLLKPAYEDGVWAPRLHSISGKPLSSPRTISVNLLPDLDRPDYHLNLLLMQFGQFIAHDFSRSSSIKIDDKEIQCCTSDGSHALQGEESHYACLPIDVSPHDPFYSKFGVRCLNFVRLALAKDKHCKMGYAKQGSKVSHFVDASTVYGSSKEHSNSLRSFEEGQLLNSFPAGIEHPPPNRNPEVCEPWAKVCFEAGDDRVNQIISLVQVQTLFLREHNRIARNLDRLNPQWDDETVFQEARRIVIAEIQKILYNEYLPLIVGWEKARQYGLPDESYDHSDHYSDRVKPFALSEVSAAAFRFGHSTVQGHFQIQHRHSGTESVPIHTVFDNPSKVLTPSSFDDYIYSLGQQVQQKLDSSVTLGLTGLLFAGKKPFGNDLASLNIQRGRDHALRPYNDYRVWAGLPKIHSFHELGHIGSKLAQVYESPDDIDLWIGGLLEPAEGDGLVGETFGHLIADQFARLKYGDRYYYTNGPKTNPGAFTPQQLLQIHKVSLASVICANVDKRFDFYQAPRAFLKSSQYNEPISCEKYRDLNLGAWKH